MKAGHELITAGPYALVRHPIYTGLLLAIAGCAPNSASPMKPTRDACRRWCLISSERDAGSGANLSGKVTPLIHSSLRSQSPVDLSASTSRLARSCRTK
ncbi:MAG: hypothetical protein ABSE19_12320 [Candidatus Acidiferrum sp.]